MVTTWRQFTANAVGGNLFLGFISAVAFATILAVVAGRRWRAHRRCLTTCTLTSSKKGATEREELRVSKITVLILGVIAIILGVLFENQNIAFMVGLAFAIAASCNFPIILLSMYWSKLTTRGAMMGGWLGLITAVVLMILGPTIWVQILGHEKPSSRMNTRRCSLSAWHSSVSGSSQQRIIQRKVRASVNCSVRSLSAPRPGFGVEQGRAH